MHNCGKSYKQNQHSNKAVNKKRILLIKIEIFFLVLKNTNYEQDIQ